MTETKPFNISKRAVMTAYKTKHDNLKKLGINEYKAWEYANTRKGYWRISNRVPDGCFLLLQHAFY